MSRSYSNRTLAAIMARRSAIISELSKLSSNGWAGARPVDYAPLEAELRGLDQHRVELEDVR